MTSGGGYRYVTSGLSLLVSLPKVVVDLQLSSRNKCSSEGLLTTKQIYVKDNNIIGMNIYIYIYIFLLICVQYLVVTMYEAPYFSRVQCRRCRMIA